MTWSETHSALVELLTAVPDSALLALTIEVGLLPALLVVLLGRIVLTRRETPFRRVYALVRMLLEFLLRCLRR